MTARITRSGAKSQPESEVIFLGNDTPFAASTKINMSRKNFGKKELHPALFNIHIHVPSVESPKSSAASIQPQIHLHFNDILTSLTSGGSLDALVHNKDLGDKIKSLFSINSEKSDSLTLINEFDRSVSRPRRRNSIKKIKQVEENSQTKSSVGRKKRGESSKSPDLSLSLENKLKNLVKGQLRKNLFNSSSEYNLWSNRTDKDDSYKLKKAVVLLKDIGFKEKYYASDFDQSGVSQTVVDFTGENFACETSTPKSTVNRKRALEQKLLKNETPKKIRRKHNTSTDKDVEEIEKLDGDRELGVDVEKNEETNLEVVNSSVTQKIQKKVNVADKSIKGVEKLNEKDESCGRDKNNSSQGKETEESNGLLENRVDAQVNGNENNENVNTGEVGVSSEKNNPSGSENDAQEDLDDIRDSDSITDLGDTNYVADVNGAFRDGANKESEIDNDKQRKGILVKDDQNKKHLNVSFDEQSIQDSKTINEEEQNIPSTEKLPEKEAIEKESDETSENLVEPENKSPGSEIEKKKSKKPKEVENELFSSFRKEKRKLRSFDCVEVKNRVGSSAEKSAKKKNKKAEKKETPEISKSKVKEQETPELETVQENQNGSCVNFTSEEETEETVPLTQPDNAFWSVKRRNGKVYSLIYNSDSDSQEVPSNTSGAFGCNFSELLKKVKNKKTREKILKSLKNNDLNGCSPECGKLIQELLQETQNTFDEIKDEASNETPKAEKKELKKRSKKSETVNSETENKNDDLTDKTSVVEKKPRKKRSKMLEGADDETKDNGESDMTINETSDVGKKQRKRSKKVDSADLEIEENNGEGGVTGNETSDVEKKPRTRSKKVDSADLETEENNGEAGVTGNGTNVEKKTRKGRPKKVKSSNGETDGNTGKSVTSGNWDKNPHEKKSKKVEKIICQAERNDGDSGEADEALGEDLKGEKCNGAEGVDVSKEEFSQSEEIQLSSEVLESVESHSEIEIVQEESVNELLTASSSSEPKKMKRSDKKTKVTPKSDSKSKSKKPSPKKSISKKPTPKNSKASSSEDYIPLNASGPTKFAVAPLNKIKPYEKHEATSLKNKLIFSSKNNRTKDLRVYKEKQRAAKRASMSK